MTDNRLFDVALGSPLIAPLKRKLNGGGFLSLGSVADAAKPFAISLIAEISRRPVLVVTADLKSQEAIFNDLRTLRPNTAFFPAWETLANEDSLPAVDTIADRLNVISSLANSPIIVGSVQSVMQRTFSPEFFDSLRQVVRVGDEIGLQPFVDRLMQTGYHPEIQVGERGDMAARGGLVDFFPLDRDSPVRIEFFGDRVDSIRLFDPTTQQSIEKCESVSVSPAGELGLLKTHADKAASLLSLLPSDAIVVFDELDQLAAAAAAYEKQVPAANPFHEPWQNITADKRQQIYLTEALLDESSQTLNLKLASLDAFRPLETRTPEPEIAERMRQEFFDQIRHWRDEDYTLRIFCSTDGEIQRFQELWREQFPTDNRSLIADHLSLSRGFIWPDARLVVVTDAEIFGRYKLVRPRRKFHQMSQPSDWTEFQEGDYVVHLQHGIGKFLGLRTIETAAPTTPAAAVPARPLFEVEKPATVRQEVLAIEYANEARLYVPIDQAHLVTKYISAGKKTPPLHELGGGLWQRQKHRAERAILDLASELLEIQAARATLEGHPFSPDTAWQREFEAAFPYDETPDQETAIAQVKTDMESRKPMDRLICGDVGYGKTEVAIRAAFKAVMDGFQVAVLVPTTILAEQHYNTFRERMAGYPITVDMLSRFRSQREQKLTVHALRAGGVDIIIGTHRILSADIAFKNIGLVVIDEEQRFGVLHKEKFKQLRKLIDVLTLSATPIPRTLYLSLTGARDMSTIQTPPQDRLPVETIVIPYDERVIKRAIQREINRGGQVYFLHNRVQSIEGVAHRLRTLFETDDVRDSPQTDRDSRSVIRDSELQNPPAESPITHHPSRVTSHESRVTSHDSRSPGPPRIDIGHGQMHEHQLEDVMHRFVKGDIDVLVCTTIIESGLDIPNANTIIIDRADRFGLSDLYQLRGRVGRYKHQAYAYILLPRHLQLVQSARKRISAIRQYSSLGSGFKIAMRDLEIRGAGNILGSEQSGHITAIGFDLYCQLLKESVGRLKGEKTKRPAHVVLKLDFLATAAAEEDTATEAKTTLQALANIPGTYIPSSRLRVEAYRRIAACSALADVDAVRAELDDRYGKPPRQVELLLQCADLKVLAGDAKFDMVETRVDKIMLSQRGQLFQVEGKFPRLTKTKPEGKLTEIKKLLKSLQG